MPVDPMGFAIPRDACRRELPGPRDRAWLLDLAKCVASGYAVDPATEMPGLRRYTLKASHQGPSRRFTSAQATGDYRRRRCGSSLSRPATKSTKTLIAPSCAGR